MRLIDADALSIKHLEPGKTVTREYTTVWNYAASLVEAAPTIDAVPVVRCMDCKYGHCFDGNRWSCLWYGSLIVMKSDFCARGVRRDDE